MAIMVPMQDRNTVQESLRNDRRDVKDLWIDATREYKKILGSDAQDLNTRFRNVDDMINFGNDRTNVFSKWRHDDGRLDKIRSLFRSNINLIEAGTQKLIAAATPAFPPASIISTALTFVLAGCKSVSADFDVVTVFFEEMNSFLQRVKILEGRLPSSREYQTSLTDVFTSLLAMCAFATKFIKNGRFKKWMVNAFVGEDGDLAGARSQMQKSLSRLQSATELAILANTEETRNMNIELNENSKMHTELLMGQQVLLESVSQQQRAAQEDLAIIKKILIEQKGQAKDSAVAQDVATNRAEGIRRIIPDNFENMAELNSLQDSRVPQTCEWLFEDADWKDWLKRDPNAATPPLLTLYGPSGIGKSYLAVAAYDHLKRNASHEADQQVCVASFFCRRGVAALRSFQNIINSSILQMSDQDVLIHEQVSAELAKDDDTDEPDYLNKLLVPIFRQGSTYQLYIIIDAVEELETDHDRGALKAFVDLIIAQQLNIRVFATARRTTSPATITESAFDASSVGKEIIVNKSMILPDLKKIIEDRLNSTDSAFQGLRRLSKNVKKEIASSLEADADGLLYVNVALRHLSNIGREGAIMRELRSSLPDTTAGFFEKDMGLCWRRTPDSLLEAMKLLMAWLTFGFDSLTLGGSNALVQMYAGDADFLIEDELLGVYGRIIQIQSITASDAVESAEDPPASALGAELVDEISSYDDQNFIVTFRYRAMREVFFVREGAYIGRKSGFSRSAAHMAMFLLCFRLIEEHQTISSSTIPSMAYPKLYEYAIKYCVRHWQNIDCSQHTRAENMIVLDSFSTLLSNRHYLAAQIEAKGHLDYSIDLLIAAHRHADHDFWLQKFSKDWNTWSEWLVDSLSPPNGQQQVQIKTESLEYWSSKDHHCLLPLAKAHISNWLNATEDEEAQTSFEFAGKLVQMTHIREIPHHHFRASNWKSFLSDDERPRSEVIEEIYTLRSLSEHAIDSNAHWATAVAIGASNFIRSQQFLDEIDMSISKCNDPLTLFRNRVLKAEYYRCEDLYVEGEELMRATLSQRDGVPPTWISAALWNLITFLERSEDDHDDQRESMYREIRHLDAVFFVPGEVLFREIEDYHRAGKSAQVMNTFSELTQTQRLTLISHVWSQGESWIHPWLTKAAVKEGKVDTLIMLYEGIIHALDEEGSGAAWRRYLADLHQNIKHDDEAAKAVLVTALDQSCKTRHFELFQLDTGFVAMKIVNAMSDIIYQQFRRAVKPQIKSELLKQAQALLQQTFPKSVQLSVTQTIPHQLVVANMVRKIGLAEDWQKCIQQTFDIIWANLHDTIDWNDNVNFYHLSRVLGQIPAFSRDSQILNAAQYYWISDESAFKKYLDSNQKGHLYNSGSEARLKAWIEALPTVHKHVRLGKMRWDTQTNDWEYVSELPDEYEFAELVDVDIDNLEGADVDLGDGWKASYTLLLDWDYFQKKDSEWNSSAEKEEMEEYWFSRFYTQTRGWSTSELADIYRDSKCAGCADQIISLDRSKTFTCLLCTEVVLCQYCHDRRMAMNNDGEPEAVVRFCCDGGQYVKAPVDKWQGIREGYVYIKGQEPFKWDEYLEGLKTRWDEWWVEFWRG